MSEYDRLDELMNVLQTKIKRSQHAPTVGTLSRRLHWLYQKQQRLFKTDEKQASDAKAKDDTFDDNGYAKQSDWPRLAKVALANIEKKRATVGCGDSVRIGDCPVCGYETFVTLVSPFDWFADCWTCGHQEN